MRRQRKRSIWTDPEGFSIIDMLALSFSITYLCLVVLAVWKSSEVAIQIQGQMNIPMGTIIGGYFGDQIIQHFSNSRVNQNKSTRNTYDDNMYP
ncbi:hypothetical protein SAMN05660297_02730 [Natronincola peptidivorans]|uniref:Uncharacterized protein n=1 Tax=Natronincola peptidivorans TaxID=426128 RepID=A0A1I0FBY0_9FIRM|nr:hypothetical protein [Natronincola peptidivorans]SET55031.1 hypothetical protein SAMN05660297_02730 [Natronincola peptidivorans]